MGFMKKFAGLFIGDDIEDEEEMNEEAVEGGNADEQIEQEASYTERETVRPAAPKAVELKVIRLSSYDSEIKRVADHLKSKKTVVLIIEDASAESARRIIDFLVGVTYTIGGQLKHITAGTYIVTPSNVAISNEQLEEAATMSAESESAGMSSSVGTSNIDQF